MARRYSDFDQENIPLSNYTSQDGYDDREATTESGNGSSSYHDTGNTNGQSGEESEEDVRAALYGALPKIDFFIRLWNGPINATDEPPSRIGSFLRIEELPEKFNKRYSRRFKIGCLSLYLALWFLLVYRITIPYLTVPPVVIGEPDTEVKAVSCTGDSEFWRGRNGACGLNGEYCPSFNTEKDIVIRCPALCDRDSFVFSYVPVGDKQIKYRSFVVGGGKLDSDSELLTHPYRADSSPCGSAVHAGLISPFRGGCARIRYTGAKSWFPSKKGSYGTGQSIEFPSFFPSSFSFKNLISPNSSSHVTHCYDPRFMVLILNIILGVPVVFFASGAVAFWVINVVGFWTICLATDPPRDVDPSDPGSFASLISLSLQRFLPSVFIMYVLWHSSVKRTLSNSRKVSRQLGGETSIAFSPLSRVCFWYPFTWLGVLNNVTFDRLPVDRLTSLDLQRVETLISVTILALVIFSCAIYQAYAIWLSGRFRGYLALYGSFIIGLALVSCIPNLSLRIHHYILALLLIPGCATRGRVALSFQGILMGLFLSGAARWGLASIAETFVALNRDDPLGSVLPPEFIGFDNSTGLLSWQEPNVTLSNSAKAALEKFDAISLLINDIERFVGNIAGVNLRELFQMVPELKSSIDSSLKSGFKDDAGNILIYIRIGRKILLDQVYSDFSKAAILKWPSGEFTNSQPGLT